MRLSTGLFAWCIAAGLLISLGLAQSPAAAQKGKTDQNSQKAIIDALKSDRFVLSSDGSDYRLAKPIKTTSADKSVAMDYQIGTFNDKPAFITVLGDEKTLPKKSSDLDAAFGGINLGGIKTASGDGPMQMCTGERVCVETTTIDGKPVCVKWRCK